MKKETKISMQVGVLIGLGLILAVSATVVAAMILALRASHANHAVLEEMGKLDEIGQAIERRALQYADHAPRDYCPYDRDVVIFYPEFLADLEAYDRLIAQAVRSVAGVGMGDAFVGGSFEAPREALNKLEAAWTKFRRELAEKLGDNPAEPRLEWGAEYIRDHKAELNAVVGELTRTVEAAIAGHQRAVDRLVVVAALAGGLLVLAIAAWFYLRVVRRVVVTVDGCRRVAQGEFGYQVPVSGRDELAVLADAVNRLSSRARLVLELLDNMQRSDTVDHKLAFFLTDAGAYLGSHWLGLWQKAPDGELELLHSAAADLPEHRQRGVLNAADRDSTLPPLMEHGEVVLIGDISGYIATRPTARLLRELVKIGYARSALAVPLASDDGWDGLLILASKDGDNYDEEHAALLGNLSRVLANGLARAIRESSPAKTDS